MQMCYELNFIQTATHPKQFKRCTRYRTTIFLHKNLLNFSNKIVNIKSLITLGAKKKGKAQITGTQGRRCTKDSNLFLRCKSSD